MTKQEFNDLYLGKVVHCDTEEKANAFLKLAHGAGYKWSNDKSLMDLSNYFEYYEKTCYKVSDEGITYASLRFYRGEGLTIVEFETETIKENTMKYKVGDKVRVRKDLFLSEIYGGSEFIDKMISFKGQQVTIKGSHRNKYFIEEDGGVWDWSDEMLEPLEKVNGGTTMKYNAGDKVRVRKDLLTNEGYGGIVFNTHMASFKGQQVTIKRVRDGYYYVAEDDGRWTWADDMLETFDVGDVVYNLDSPRPLTVLRKAWVVCYQDQTEYELFVEERDLSKNKPLQKLTRKELADKGYVLVD